MKLVRKAAGLSADEKIKLKEFPAKKSIIETLLSEEPDSSEPSALVRAFQLLQPLVRIARQTGLLARPEDVLVMPQ